MLDNDELQSGFVQFIQWSMSNYERQISIAVREVVEGEDYIIYTSTNVIRYTAQSGDTVTQILTGLDNAFVGRDAVSVVVDDTLVITKQHIGNAYDYFFYFELSDNLKLIPALSGRVIIMDQNQYKPPKPYMALKIIQGPTPIQSASGSTYNPNTKRYQSSAISSVVINLQSYGKNSGNYINYLQFIWRTPEVLNYIAKLDFSIYDYGSIIDVATLLNDGLEHRYSIDIFVYTRNVMSSSLEPANATQVTLNTTVTN